MMIRGLAAVAIVAGLSSCSHEMETWTEAQKDQASYEYAFVKRFGEPSPTQTWGFGDETTRALTRSMETPTVKAASAPYDAAWVANYLTTAKEPNDVNIAANSENDKMPTWEWSQEYKNKRYTTGFTAEEQKFYDENIKPHDENNFAFYGTGYGTTNYDYSLVWYEVYKRVIAGGYSSWANVTSEPKFVSNFKITDTWTGPINVVATEGYTNGVKNGNERTVVVTGKWNLTDTQKIGALGRVIVADGGEINISSGKTLQSVNQAQIVVLPGGKITGSGNIEFANGTSNDNICYNGGTIEVNSFNNNGGEFYNNGTLKATSLLGGASASCYYNNGIISIQNTGLYDSSSANTRIFNNCQFYCSDNMRIRLYEGAQGSSLICDGELQLSWSEENTTVDSYVGLAAGALVQCGTLKNNGTSWSGPTTGGYAVLDILNKITYLNWEQDAPEKGGYFANNIYVCAGDWTNAPGGNGMGGETAEAKFKNVMNATGNGNVKIIEKSDKVSDELIPTDSGFKKGENGCTPGFRGKTPDPEPDPDPDPTPNIRVIAEDLTVDEKGDFDFNDVVFDVIYNYPEGKTTIILQAAGGTLPLTIAGQEVHKLFGVDTNVMVNTRNKSVERNPVKFVLDTYYANANDIPVRVQKNGSWMDLEAKRGRVPSKIGVKPTYNWCDEREDIEDRYPNFGQWVQNEGITWY